MTTGMAPAKRLNVPWLNTLLLVLRFLLFLPIPFSVEGAELLYPIQQESGICRSMDIRNKLEALNELRGCQMIEGSLSILLFDSVNETDFSRYSFPELVEITDYLMIFRVNGLKSLGQLFPNLSVIRGRNLFTGDKALVIFEMPTLQEINLYSLTNIMSGKVYIDRNPALCFVRTIDWEKITHTDESNFIKSFKPENECPVCPASVNGNVCPRNEKDNSKFLCWNQDHCQRLCPKCGNKACNEQGECCHERCTGGCGEDTTKCMACKEFMLTTGEDASAKCVQHCPNQFLSFLNRRCITHSECLSMPRPIDYEEHEATAVDHPYKVHAGQCLLYCPPNYSGNYTEHSCKKCNNTCRKECPGARIDSLNLAWHLRGCTHITGNVEIQIRGGNQVVKSLQENLGMIEEIDGYLKIVRSFSLVSLNFLKNLKRIKGNTLESQRYSLIVLDNQNLQDLFDWNTHKEFKIDNGSLFFHFNPKLCMHKIDELRKKANLRAHSNMEIASNSNGDKVACTVSKLEVNISSISSKYVSLEWHPFELEDPRKLLSYVVYNIEAPLRNVNFYDGRDACGQDNWHVDDVANNLDVDPVRHTISNLKPFTQYAFFVKTYTIASEQRGAQSMITYFITKPAQPSEPHNVQVTSPTSDSLKITWMPPRHPNGKISHYFVYGAKHEYYSLPNRNYCIDSVTPEPPKSTSTAAPKTQTQECKSATDKTDSKTVDEHVELARIEFENALHNKVYVRRPVEVRNKRSAELIDKNTPNLTEPFELTVPDYFNFDNNSLPNNRINFTNTTELATHYKRTFAFKVPAHQRILEVKDLRHYTVYDVMIWACRERVSDDQEPSCGEAAYDTQQTIHKFNADSVHNVSIVNTTSSSVTVSWAQPPEPNRIVVAYMIYYKREDTKNTQSTKECISFKEFRNFTKDGRYLVHTIPKLFSGNHSLFVKAVSLYGQGLESEHVVFYIPESGPNVILIVCLVLLFFILMILGGGWYFYLKAVQNPEYRIRPSVNPDYLPSVYLIDEWEVPRKNVELLRELGQGSFGMVWEGQGSGFKDAPAVGQIKCAVKTVNEHATKRERLEFLNEASVMKAFNTTHVVKLLGVVSLGQPALVVMELMVNGDLKTYLRSHRPDNPAGRSPPTLRRILQMAIEIADGMAYLEGKKFVHRDLAARNCMVAEDLTVKIGDFGMTRDIYETDYYRKGSRGLLPVRWMSPESLKDGVFSSSSDAWSYGVVLWEMATLASQPYQGLSNEQVLRYIMDGGTMQRPEDCPDKLYEVMSMCWNHTPGLRPTFLKLCEMLLTEAHPGFSKVSFYHSPEGVELRAAKAATAATVPAMAAAGEDGGEGDDVDASTPLNVLPRDAQMTGEYGASTSERSDSIRSVHVDPNPRFYSISTNQPTANGFIAGGGARNGRAQPHI
ncbi:hypothetical protein ABEB36_011201 [Hypothenemus hampei]